MNEPVPPLALQPLETPQPIGPIRHPSTPAPQHPSTRFMLTHPAHAIALGFGSGLSPKAPGTVVHAMGLAGFSGAPALDEPAEWKTETA